MGEVHRDNLFDWLQGFEGNPEVTVVEDFVTDFKRLGAGRFHTTETAQVIGSIRYWAFLRGSIIYMQQPYEKKIGYAALKMPQPKTSGKGAHQRDALAHAALFCRKLDSGRINME